MNRNLMRTLALAVVAAALFLAPLNGYADSLSYVSFIKSAGQTVSMVSYDDAGVKHTYGGTASNFNVKVIDDGTLIQTPNTTDQDLFTAFCVDPFQTAGAGTVELVAPSAVQGGLQAAWLFETYYKSSPTPATVAALQVALWEVVVDYDKPYNLKTGDFYVTQINNVTAPSETVTNATWSLADAMLADLQQNFNTKDLDYIYRIAQSSGKQDLIVRLYDPPVVADPPAAGASGTPEPATMVLMGIGLIGLAGFRKFRKN